MANVAVSPASMVLSVFWQLRDLYVAPDHRRRGVGRALVDVVVADARAAGPASIDPQTGSATTGPLTLYRSAGFEVVSELTMLNLML